MLCLMSESLDIVEIAKSKDLSSSDEPDEDLKLVELFRSGDRIAFDRLVTRYQARIIGLCVKVLGNTSDGEDAAQDTFMKMYKNIAQFRGNSRFSTWLYTIALNTCRNSGRSWWSNVWKKSYKLDKQSSGEDGGEYNRELCDTRMLPSKDLDRNIRATVIERAIKKLPAIHRELVILRDFQELSYEEIKTITKISLGTIKSRLARARGALQQELRGVYDEQQ